MTEQIKRLSISASATVQQITNRSEYVMKALQALEMVLQRGKDSPEQAHDACIAALEIMQTLQHTQEVMPDD